MKENEFLLLDSNKGIYIDGGRVYSTSSSIDLAETGMLNQRWIFINSNISASSTVAIKDWSGNEVISFCANTCSIY